MKKSTRITAFILVFLALSFTIFVVYRINFPLPPSRISIMPPSTLSLNSLPPPEELTIAIVTWQFWISDTVTSAGVQNARITIYWDDPFMGHAVYQLYTDANGYGTIITQQYQWTYVKVEAQDYTIATYGPFDSRTSSLGFHWALTPSGTSSSYATLTIYAQADSTRDDIKAGVIYAGTTNYFDDQNYPYKAQVWNLPTNASVLVEAKGFYSTAPLSQTNFDYHINLQTGSNGTTSEYWIDVMTGTVQSGTPPVVPPPFDWQKFLSDFFAFLANYWYILIIVGVAVYLLPSFASFVISARQITKPRLYFSFRN